MKNLFAALAIFTAVLGGVATAMAADAPPPPLDVVTLKDGSNIYGEVIEMAGGVLAMKTPSSPDNVIKVKWSDVAKLEVNHPIPFHLNEGTILIRPATAGPEGHLKS